MLFNNSGAIIDNPENMTKEAQALIMECAIRDSLSDSEIQVFLENHNEVNTALGEEVVLEKTIVRLDKKAKLSRSQRMAMFTIAKEHNDPKFKKLLTVWKMERFLENFLFKKYGNEALRRAKKAMYNVQGSHSSVIKKVANSVTNQLNKNFVKK